LGPLGLDDSGLDDSGLDLSGVDSGGVDGCAGGWLLASMDQPLALFRSFGELLEAHPAKTLFVDIPMGLPDKFARDLESQARKLLPGRSGSLFPVPCRQAVYASTYEDACETNFRHLGKKISKQTWNICPKIREVDRLLCSNASLQERVSESHPELAFYLLSPAGPHHSKKTLEGIEERLNILASYYEPVREYYDLALEMYPRKLVARDDALDAMILMVLGSLEQTVLADSSTKDELGLKIRMTLPRTLN
jgi:predicted RNase H-like nuclease